MFSKVSVEGNGRAGTIVTLRLKRSARKHSILPSKRGDPRVVEKSACSTFVSSPSSPISPRKTPLPHPPLPTQLLIYLHNVRWKGYR
jgi:hypothetical protein